MSENKQTYRLSKVAKELNVGISTITEFLTKKGYQITDISPNAKISEEIYNVLLDGFMSEKKVKEESQKIEIDALKKSVEPEPKKEEKKETFNEEEPEEREILIKGVNIEVPRETVKVPKEEPASVKIIGKIDLESLSKKPEHKEKTQAKEKVEKIEKLHKETVPEIKEEVKEILEKTTRKTTKVKIEEEPKEVIITEVIQPVQKIEVPEEIKQEEQLEIEPESKLKIVGKIDLDSINKKTKPEKKTAEEKKIERKEKKKKTGKKESIIEEKGIESEKIVVSEEPAKEEIVILPEIEQVIEEPVEKSEVIFRTKIEKLEGPTIIGKIVLPEAKKEETKQPSTVSEEYAKAKKKKRKRIKKEHGPIEAVKPSEPKTLIINPQQETKKPSVLGKPEKDKTKRKLHGLKEKEKAKVELSEEDIKKQIKETLARLGGSGKSKSSKYRRQKREEVSKHLMEDIEKQEEEKKILKVTEFVTANELATMMDVPVTQIISSCMSLGIFVSINQRLDAETLAIVAEEFGYKVEFVSVEVQEAIKEEEDEGEDLYERAPIVTVMGHVDHGKTSLLDNIRKTNVIAGEAGGITQHIGAYEVTLNNGKKITFIDTPGHEAFTAMRARGAQITDIAIIVIAADDNVMPQTIEAINHAQAAGVPIIFAINKIDKPNANPTRIKEELAKLNLLVEEWGGKYQSQEIAAKKGINVELLLEKVLLEAELLELKANPEKKAAGTIIESSLDKGRGYVVTLLVRNGTLKIGDVILAGCYSGKVKAIFNERGSKLTQAGPSSPVQILGFDGAPQAGDKFNVMIDEKEAKNIVNKRLQLQREQGLRTTKHITLDEIGRRIAIGDFQELNIIIKGDVDGSIEALSDALLRLSTEKIQVSIIHKSVGPVTESDVLLASASNAIIIGFQVRPTLGARKLAEQEQIDIRLHSIIYAAINEIELAIEGMLAPEYEEKIVCNIEVREIFKITKVGTIAGCMVLDGKVTRNTRIRVIRQGIVVFTGELGSLKRFKDDVKEVSAGYECGLNVNNFNDVKVGDIIEGYEEVEIKKK